MSEEAKESPEKQDEPQGGSDEGTEEPVAEDRGDENRGQENAPPPKALGRLDTFTMVDDKTRSFIHGKLRAYEARRKAAYTGKLESSGLYWRSFRDLLAASIHETSRAERLVLGVAKANFAYSQQMLASYEDVLVDDKGAMVLDQKKQLRLLEVRSTQDYAAAPLSPTSGEHQEQRSFLTNQRRSNMLSPLIDSQAILADKFSESSKQMEREICEELTQLRIELETKVDFIRQVGDAIIAELEATETEVAQTWDSYYAVAVKTLAGSENTNTQQMRRSIPEGEEEIVEDCLDVWIVEMHYRVTVAYQSFAWEKASAELSKLFASMKETECRRRVSVREYLVAFTQRQDRLFKVLPDVHTPVLKQLVGRDMDRSSLEGAVQDDIRKRADRLAKEDARMKSQKKIKSPAAVVDDKEGNFTLQSPMQSELMCRARVVERKGTGMMASWRLSLAVITVDSFLHLFDLPAGKVSLGSAPEVAFQVLVPKVEIPSSEALKNKKGTAATTNFIKGWCDLLAPSESMVLPNCSISQPKLGRETSSFEVQEAIFNTGASKMFGKTTTRRITLRTINKRETQDWIAALKSRK